MSDHASELSFDRADFSHGEGATPCGACGNGLGEQYWTFRGHVMCEVCRQRTAESLATNTGSFFKALLFGGLTALACGIAYGLFVHFSNVQLALATIGIAFVIAKVVRGASAGRGGLRYQLLAVALTYGASAMGYAPAIFEGFRDADETEQAAEANGATSEVSQAEPASESTALGLTVGALLLVMFTLAAPVIAVFDAPLGFLIVLFGLWEAWKLTRAEPMTFEGPFRATAPEPVIT